LLAFCSSAIYAQQDCGVIDCPGRCGRFIDQNGDGFCDHGQVSDANRQDIKTQEEANQGDGNRKDAKTQENVNRDGEKMQRGRRALAVREQEQVASEQVAVDQTTVAPEEAQEKPIENKSPYGLILISAITFGLYAITFVLVKMDKMKKATHRKIWNVLLLITGLASCLLGFFLVIQINYNLKMDWLWTVKLYHVQFGIAMTIIMVIHILWHLNYWKSLVTRR